MPSTFTWLDTSEAERRRALDAIDLFRQRETVDELGLAGIRDTLSDLLAPGTSTIQTRARYFLFVPWIYLELERKGTPAEKFEARARQAELALMEALLRTDDTEGVFGRDAGVGIKRLPSSVYWNGLARLGLRLFQGSLPRYHARFGRRGGADGRRIGELPAEIEPEAFHASGAWHPHIPPPPPGFPETADLALRHDDADYLLDRLRTHASGTLFHRVADWEGPAVEVAFGWEHPITAELPAAMAGLLEHARCFSEAMHGAALLYNLLLAQALPNAELTAEYRQRLSDWSQQVERRREALRAWDRPAFWALVRRENPRIPAAAPAFAERWIGLVLGGDARRLAADEGARRLVSQRELALKGDRARLSSRSHLEQWRGASGRRPFDYRWGILQSMVREIRAGLAR